MGKEFNIFFRRRCIKKDNFFPNARWPSVNTRSDPNKANIFFGNIFQLYNVSQSGNILWPGALDW